MGEYKVTEGARLEGSARLRIGARLRTIYAPVSAEPLPAEHVELVLSQLLRAPARVDKDFSSLLRGV